jgi:3-dehydroquinate synthetase
MELVVVGAPGSGTRSVGRALAERRGARFVDLTGDPSRHPDAVSGVRLAGEPDQGPSLRRIIAADRIVADTSVRARLYRGRHVAWLDAPADQLVERLRAARRADIDIEGEIDSFIGRHLIEYMPYYGAGDRVDASGSISRTIEYLEEALARPIQPGTLVMRAEIHDSLIELGEGILGPSLVHVLQRLSMRRCVVLTSSRSRERAEAAARVVRDGVGIRAAVEELPAGEPAKLLEHQEALFQRLAALRLERGDPVVALGDEALLEAATFAAAVWLRGVPLVAVPVTTLGLIDTSIGGKGGINVPDAGRNVLGAFHQPVATILDIDLVRDEPPANRRAALSEAVKYGLIGHEGILSLLETGIGRMHDRPWPEGTDLLDLVERCALAKRGMVIHDERDTGDVRIALNLGHTVSHALEAATGYRLHHGEAVAYGLRAALRIGTSMEVTPPAVAARATRILDRLDLGRTPVDVAVDDVLGYVGTDKKRSGGKVRWVLVGRAGPVVREDVAEGVVRAAVTDALWAAAEPPRAARFRA